MKKLSFVAVLVMLGLLVGCTCHQHTYSGQPGHKLSDSSFELWPVFEAHRAVYDNAVSSDGSFLCIINWSSWRDKAPKNEVRPAVIENTSADAGAQL